MKCNDTVNALHKKASIMLRSYRGYRTLTGSVVRDFYTATSACVNCGHHWTYVGMSTNTFGMSSERAREHLSNFWGQYSPYTSPFIARRRLGNASPYYCDNCGSFDVESRDCGYAHLEAADARPLLDGQLGTRDPQESRVILLSQWRQNYKSLLSKTCLNRTAKNFRRYFDRD